MDGNGIRCVVGESSALFAEGVASVLRDAGVDVVALATAPGQVVGLLARHQPDVLVAGFEPPQASVDLVGRSRVPTLVLTWSAIEDDVIDAMRAGARGHLHKDVAPTELVRAVHDVAAGRSAFPPGWERLLVTRLDAYAVSVSRRGGDAVRLTAREREIVQLVVNGHSNKHMALALGIAQQTAKNHLRHVMAKVGVTSRVQLCAWAIERGHGEVRLAATS